MTKTEFAKIEKILFEEKLTPLQISALLCHIGRHANRYSTFKALDRDDLYFEDLTKLVFEHSDIIDGKFKKNKD